jgi:uncharacterized metal-binding protein
MMVENSMVVELFTQEQAEIRKPSRGGIVQMFMVVATMVVAVVAVLDTLVVLAVETMDLEIPDTVAGAVHRM